MNRFVSSRYLFLVLQCITFLSMLRLVLQVPTVNLDPSWSNAYNYFAQLQPRFGHDVIFTYGPLAWLELNVFSVHLYWYRIIYHVLCAVYSCFILYEIREISGLRAATLVAAGIFLFGASEDIILFMQLASLFVLIYSNRESKISQLIYVALPVFFITLTGFIKFTFWVSGIILILGAAAAKMTNKNIKQALMIGLLFILYTLLLWWITGQKFTDYPNYIFYSLEITRGYNEAMSVIGKTKYLYLSIVLMLFLSVTLFLHSRTGKADTKSLVMWVSVFISTLLAWKHGFVRHDAHQRIFFSFIGLLPGLLWAIRTQVSEGKVNKYKKGTLKFTQLVFVLFICAALIGAGPHRRNGSIDNFIDAVSVVLRPPMFTERLNLLSRETELASAKNNLPLIKETVANRPVDIYNYQQGYVLLNQLNWTPRPIFQSYSAYTSILLHKNQESLIAQPPDHILAANQTIDGRLPLLDDSLWIREVLHNYFPVLTESNFILFKKNPEFIRTIEPPLYKTQEIKIGEKINISRPAQILLSSLDIQYSFLGKMRTFIYKPPELYVKLTLEDGLVKQFRIIPEMTREPFILSPLMENNADVLKMIANENKNNVVSMELVCDAKDQIYFEKVANIRFYSDELPTDFTHEDLQRLIR